MERILGAGPDLAEGHVAMNGASRTHPLEPVRTGADACPGALARSQREARACWLPLAYYGSVVAVLAAADYPAWRIGVVAAAAGLQQLAFAGWRKRDIRRCVNLDLERISRNVALGQTIFLATAVLAAAFTGGVRSPLLVTVIAPYVAALQPAGDRRPARLVLLSTAAAAALVALLPEAITGPAPSAGAYAVLAPLSLLGLGALLAPVHARVRERREEFVRWRKELAAEALARSESLEQVGAKVAHELKNPLTGVKALVQLGLRNPAEAASHERLEVVEKEVTRMQEILQNYLSFTRPLQAVAPRQVALGPLVSDTLAVLSARADDAGVRLYAQGDAAVEADPRRLREALLNLVANAIEATSPGGEVVVEVQARGEDEAELVVRDNGRGMPPETLRRIGTPFFTTRDDGTGLGVVLARSVIAQHGGTIRYDSEPGRGTTVRVTLPGPGGPDAARAARR